MKHLLHEQQENLTELKAEGVLSLRRAQKDHWEQEEETWKEKCSLNTRLKEQELANEAAISKLCIVCPVRCLIPSVGAGGGSCLPDSLWGRAGWDFWCRNREKGLLGDPSPTVGSCERTGKPTSHCLHQHGIRILSQKAGGNPWARAGLAFGCFFQHRVCSSQKHEEEMARLRSDFELQTKGEGMRQIPQEHDRESCFWFPSSTFSTGGQVLPCSGHFSLPCSGHFFLPVLVSFPPQFWLISPTQGSGQFSP